MLNCKLNQDEGIILLNPDMPLKTVDFKALEKQIDQYLQLHGKLHGVLIHAKYFSCWKNFAELFVHLKFMVANLNKIDKVAVVADGAATGMITTLANHFTDAQLRHFDFIGEDAAWSWLRKKIDNGLFCLIQTAEVDVGK